MAQRSQSQTDAMDRTELCDRIRRQYGDRAEIVTENRQGSIYIRLTGHNCPGLIALAGRAGWHVATVNPYDEGLAYIRLKYDGYMDAYVDHSTDDGDDEPELSPNYGTFNR